MTLSVVCASCGSKLKVPETSAGGSVKCPKCGKKTSVGAPAAPSKPSARPPSSVEKDRKQITGQLEHPGIVPVYELVKPTSEQSAFYTMRFVRGRTLSRAARLYHKRRAKGGAQKLDQLTLLSAFINVCNAIAYAHSRGVIHRDLKGANVILGDFGEAVVLDWGLAKVGNSVEANEQAPPVIVESAANRQVTMEGQAIGTPAYMAPEQARGRLDQIRERTDVYGLGTILYEILTGEPPFTGTDTQELLRQVKEEEPRRPPQVAPGTSAALEAVCLKAMSKRPQNRYASPGDLAAEAEPTWSNWPAVPKPPSSRPRSWCIWASISPSSAVGPLLSKCSAKRSAATPRIFGSITHWPCR